MTMANPLQNLRDIHLPAPVSAWPPAPGWIIVLAITFILLAIVFIKARQHWQQNTIKRLALKQLKQCERQLADGVPVVHVLPHISYLLRQVALSFYEPEKVARLAGDEWADFLNKTGQTDDFTRYHLLLTNAPYQRHVELQQIPEFIRAVKRWIEHKHD